MLAKGAAKPIDYFRCYGCISVVWRLSQVKLFSEVSLGHDVGSHLITMFCN